MKMVHISTLATVALAIVVGGCHANSAVAQEKHEHAAGHDADAMKKAELKITETLKLLSPEDQKLVASQRFCPMMEMAVRHKGRVNDPLLHFTEQLQLVRRYSWSNS